MAVEGAGVAVVGGRTVLITGASSGIGEELARCYAAGGDRLILVARREERLQALAQELTATHGIDVQVMPADLSDDAAVDALVARLDAAGLVVDVLVNNAGFGALGWFDELDEQRQSDMVRVNVLALTRLTRLLLPGMIEWGRGVVLNVGSTAGFQPGPNMSVYYATKAFVLSFTEALAEELRGTGVTATVLCPGPTATEFGQAAQLGDAQVSHLGTMSAAAVAHQGHAGAERGRPLVVTGWTNRLGTLLVRIMPRRWVPRVVKRLQRPGPRAAQRG